MQSPDLGSSADIDDQPAAHLALEDARREIRQPGERNHFGHPVEPVLRQVAGEAVPRHDPRGPRAHHRVDAEQVDRAQQKRQDACRQIAAAGGDTVAALAAAGVTGDLTYISTAGGAFLEWLEGRELPGVKALDWGAAP